MNNKQVKKLKQRIMTLDEQLGIGWVLVSTIKNMALACEKQYINDHAYAGVKDDVVESWVHSYLINAAWQMIRIEKKWEIPDSRHSENPRLENALFALTMIYSTYNATGQFDSNLYGGAFLMITELVPNLYEEIEEQLEEMEYGYKQRQEEIESNG